MNAKKRARLIEEAVAAGKQREMLDREPIFRTVDFVTGLENFDGSSAMISVPFEPYRWAMSGRIKIDLPAMGYKLVKVP